MLHYINETIPHPAFSSPTNFISMHPLKVVHHLILPRKRALIPSLTPLTSTDRAPILCSLVAAEALVTRRVVTLEFCGSTECLISAR